jgi:hypothetical protein
MTIGTLRGILICAITMLAGCTAFEHPIVGEIASPPDKRLVGRWVGQIEDEEEVRLVVRRNGSVEVTFVDPDSAPETENVPWITSNIDGVQIANLGLDVDGKVYWKAARYEVTKRDELRVYFCNDETWFGAVKSGVISGKADEGRHGPSTVVSATQADVREFVRANSDKAFLDDPVVFRRKR